MPHQNPYEAPQVVHSHVESGAETEPQAATINFRALLIVALTALAIGWLIFFLIEFPWIVPADSLGADVTAIAWAGGQLLLGSMAAIWIVAGVVGHGRWSIYFTTLLLVYAIYCGWSLYPTPELWRHPVRLAMHVLQCAILIYWLMQCWRQLWRVSQ